MASIKPENTNSIPVGVSNNMENHKTIAGHLIAAAAHHFKTANHLRDGNYENAANCAALAQQYFDLASEAKLKGSTTVI